MEKTSDNWQKRQEEKMEKIKIKEDRKGGGGIAINMSVYKETRNKCNG